MIWHKNWVRPTAWEQMRIDAMMKGGCILSMYRREGVDDLDLWVWLQGLLCMPADLPPTKIFKRDALLPEAKRLTISSTGE